MSETIEVEGVGSVEVTFSERGTGPALLVLHGGAGPLSVVPWAELVARTRGARVVTPIHPGFQGTPRPAALADVRGLARLYAGLIGKLGLDGVTLVGNSVGGWIAAELALSAPGLLRKLVLVDAVGIEVPGHEVLDVFAVPPAELSRYSFYDAQRFAIDPSKLTPEQRATMAGNMATLKVYGGAMKDPTLRGRLSGLEVPTLVAWGEADGVVDAAYGRAWAEAIPGARFELLAKTGHVPQVETPELLAETVWRFVTGQG